MSNETLSRTAWRTRVLKLSLPIMLSNSTVPLVGIVDTAVMGRMGSPDWIAATAVGAILFSSIYWIFGFLRMGTSGLVAQADGARDEAAIGRILIRAMLIAVAIGLLLVLLQTPILRVSLLAMQDQTQWLSLTEEYFRVRILSAPATLLNYAVLGALIGLQQTGRVLQLQLLLNLLNIVLNIVLFKYTQMNISGVALATVISEYVSLAVGLWLLRPLVWRALNESPWRLWLFDTPALLRFFHVSKDLFIRTLCLTISYYWMTAASSHLGVLIVAVNAVLLHLVYMASYCMDGYAHSMESLVGYAVGQRNKTMFNQATRAAIELGFVTAGIISLAYLLFGHWIIGLLTTEQSVIDQASTWLPWVAAVPLVGIASFLLDGIFIGAVQTAAMRNSMVQSLLIFIVSNWLLMSLFGNHGLWMSYHLMLIARAVTLGRYWPLIISSIDHQASVTTTTHSPAHKP